MIDWPSPHTISDSVRDIKERFLESFHSSEEESEKVQDLNYIVAVSSGKAVTEDIPKQIGRRAGWASQQGANFVEILIENPSQLVMDQEMLINLADRLDLHYNIHSSTSLAYGMSYRVGRGNGYDSAHEYTIKLLKAIRRFRSNLEAHSGVGATDANGHPRLYAVNGHMAQAQFPPEEERLATDVSVDPYGHPIEESDIFSVPEARLGIWRHFIWDFLGIGNDLQDFARVMNLFEETRDIQDFVRSNLVDLLEQDGYISDEQLKAIEALRQEGSPAQRIFEQRFRDMPSKVSDLKRHINGRALAQRAATSSIWDEIPADARDVVEDYLDDQGIAVPETQVLDLSAPQDQDNWDQYETDAQNMVMQVGSGAFQEVERLLRADGEYSEEEAQEAMQKMARMRLLHDDFNKESSIFRHMVPLWMPFAEEEQVRQIWENITERSFDDHTDAIDWLYGGDGAMNHRRHEEDVIAAATGAYVWGHFTQIPPGYDRTVIEELDRAGVFFSFESHMAGPAENARIWKPKDMVEVVKAINSTPVEVRTENGTAEKTIDRTRITIDMEHIATQKVDPMWVVDPSPEIQEKENYKGLDDGDGRYIMINHVTHPYIGEQQHHHGPVRRGDTLVYRYIHTLVEKGMCTDDVNPTIVMYEIGGEKAETIFMLRLILNMIEHGIDPEQLEGPAATEVINKDEPDGLEEYLIQKFFGVTDTEVQHEWQEIFEHALDPLDDLLESPSGGHTWMGRAATESGTRPEEWEGEEYR